MLNGDKDSQDPAQWIVDVLKGMIHFGSGLVKIHIGTSFTAFNGVPGKESTEEEFSNSICWADVLNI